METLWRPYTSTPEGLRIARDAHARHESEIRNLPHVEILPTNDDLKSYLRERVPPVPPREPWMGTVERVKQIEQLLTDDLYRARSENANPDLIDHIRSLIWLIGQKLHQSSSQTAMKTLLRHIDAAETERDFVGRYDADEAAEKGEHIKELSQLEEALRIGVTGEELRPSAEIIENEMSGAASRMHHGYEKIRDAATREFELLRVVRNEVYLRFLFPSHARMQGVGRRSGIHARPASRSA